MLTLNSMGRDCCNRLSEERERAVSERDTPITTPVYQHFSKDKWIGLPACYISTLVVINTEPGL